MRMPDGYDVEHLKRLMILHLRQTGGGWGTFDSLAWRLCGDPARAALLAGIADLDRKVFVVHQNNRVKLTIEGAHLAEALDEPSTTMHEIAAEAVRAYANQLDPIGIPISGAGPGQRILERFLHGLVVGDSDDDLRLADDTPVQLRAASGSLNLGYVAGLSRDLATIYVAFEHEVLPADLPATLVVYRNRTWLDVADQLGRLSETPQRAVELRRHAAGTGFERRDSWLLSLDLQYLPRPWTRVLWGPPGAGKTYCLASFTAGLVQDRAERVLLVAPSNVAVDVATLQLVRLLEKSSASSKLIPARKVLRYGYPRDERILSRPELLGPEEMAPLSNCIEEGFREIRRLTQRRAPDAALAAVRAEVRQLSEERKRRIAAHAVGAQIVTTTLAALASPTCPLNEAGPWQTVILDEASMVGGAVVMFLASKARQRFLIAGDPRQLGPVFEWKQGEPPAAIQTWIAKDPYELAGLSTGAGLDKVVVTRDQRVARIMCQRRCHVGLWASISSLYPGVSSDVGEARAQLLADLAPAEGQPFVVLDLSTALRIAVPDAVTGVPEEDVALDYDSACRKVGRTWQNPPTAMLTIDVAREIRAQARDVGIAIISPYRGQVRLIRRWLDDELRADPNLADIEVGTVHAFQGGESDVVIFDIVDGPPRSGVGALLRGDCGTRLANVAISRARGKLILIAHKAWFATNSNRPEAGLLWDVLMGDAAARHCAVQSPRTETGVPTDQTESPIEEVLLEELRNRHTELPPFALQHRILDELGRLVSRAEFAFVAEKVAIFCDGARYHLRQHQWQRDLRQRRQLVRLGWRSLAFTGAEILEDEGRKCVEEIVAFLPGHRGHPA